MTRKLSFGGDEVPKNENPMPDIVPLSEEQKLKVQHAVHTLKIYQGKERFWKKVFGKRSGKSFYYNCLTNEKQFEEPVDYIDVMEEPVQTTYLI